MSAATPPDTAAQAQTLAEQVRDAMWAGDHATKMLGMRIVAVGPGTATIEMTVRQDMLNGHAICHGGLITTLADSTFAFACNSYNELTVASGFAIDLIAPGRLGDMLTRVQGHIRHVRLDRVSPFAVPIMLEIGRERAPGDAAGEMILVEAEEDLIAEAMS